MKIRDNSYNSISVAKGIGIICMVVGHSGCPSVMRDFIYMFHMPLFFILSGYCFKEKYLSDFKTFARKRAVGLYVPFIKYGILFLLLHNIFYRIGIYNSEYGSGIASVYYDLKTIALHFAQLFFLINYEQLISPVWFIAALFVGYFIFYAASRYVKDFRIGGLILLAIALFVVPAGHSSHPIVYRSALAALYLWGGHFLSFKYNELNKWWVCLFCFVIVGVGAVLFATEMPKVDYHTFFPYLICSVAGSLMILIVSQWISQKNSIISNIVGYMGDHTMSILIWHFTSFKIVSLIILYIKGMPILMVAKFPTITGEVPNCFWYIYVAVGIILPLLIDKSSSIIKRKFNNVVWK